MFRFIGTRLYDDSEIVITHQIIQLLLRNVTARIGNRQRVNIDITSHTTARDA
jgi:hypothetical protein